MSNPRKVAPLRGRNTMAWSIRTTPEVRKDMRVLQLLWGLPSLSETIDCALRNAILGARQADPVAFQNVLNSMGSLKPEEG